MYRTHAFNATRRKKQQSVVPATRITPSCQYNFNKKEINAFELRDIDNLSFLHNTSNTGDTEKRYLQF